MEKSKEALELENELDEIHRLQSKVHDILFSKSPFVRFFFLGKAKRMHNEAHRRLRALLTFPYIINSKSKK